MEIYPDMKISGSERELKALLQKIDALGRVGTWTREQNAEEEIKDLRTGGNGIRCFQNRREDLPEAQLWIDVGPREWSVTNIVPSDRGPLSPATYTELLLSFRAAIEPLLINTHISVTEPAFEVGPENWLSPNALRLLRQFSRAANKSTGAGHPNDRARWNRFVIATYRDNCRLDGSELSQILKEDEHWPEDQATDLGVLFEYERSLLGDLDEHR